ncbi:hypothetical protein OIO90_001311 [Microbotryomycetes sp. JL221]|nr:hypothetical protein OIO90_001311 [Microbotryomycetes sp. JL221]
MPFRHKGLRSRLNFAVEFAATQSHRTSTADDRLHPSLMRPPRALIAAALFSLLPLVLGGGDDNAKDLEPKPDTLGITVPKEVVQGKPLQFSWHGGDPPFILKILIDDRVVSQNNGWTSRQNSWIANATICEVGTVVKVRVIEKGGDEVLSEGTEVVAGKDKEDKDRHTKDANGGDDGRPRSYTSNTYENITSIVTETITTHETISASPTSSAREIIIGTTAAVAAGLGIADVVATDMSPPYPGPAASDTADSTAASQAATPDKMATENDSANTMSSTTKWALIIGGVVIVIAILSLVAWFMISRNKQQDHDQQRKRSSGIITSRGPRRRRATDDSEDEEALVGGASDGAQHRHGSDHDSADDHGGSETDSEEGKHYKDDPEPKPKQEKVKVTDEEDSDQQLDTDGDHESDDEVADRKKTNKK